MSDLTDVTIAAADGLAGGDFSSEELTAAHISALESARDLNAFVTETSDIARAGAGPDDRRARGDAAGPLEGIPLAIGDLFCTEDVLTTASSHILDAYVPACMSRPLLYSTNRWRSCWARPIWMNLPWVPQTLRAITARSRTLVA